MIQNIDDIEATPEKLETKERPVVLKTGKPIIINDKDISSSDSIKRRMATVTELGESSSDYLCCRLDPDDAFLAVGTAEGLVEIYSMKDEKLLSVLDGNTASEVPTTCLRWKPSGSSKTRNVLVAGCADGSITHWHVSSGKLLHKIQEKTNQILCMDYNSDGSMFAAAGKDYIVRVYDENTKSVSVTLEGGILSYPGHSNRVFSVKFLPEDPNVIISGGWDCTIQIWDIREGKSVGSIFGPSISGDALDYKKGVILSGSWRNANQIELWDFGTRKLMSNLDWDYGRKVDNCYVYSAQFSKSNEKTIGVGCSNLNEMRLFDRESKNRPFGKLTNMKKGIYSVDFGNRSNIIAYCGGGGELGYVSFL